MQNATYGPSLKCRELNTAPRFFMFGLRRKTAIHSTRLPVTIKANTLTAQGNPSDVMSRLSMMGYNMPARLLPVAAMPVATMRFRSK